MELICLQIDLARQKESVEYIKSYIRFAKDCGYNALLMYLENAVRTESTAFFNKEETYSKAEIADVVAYADECGIDVIPAFENLGHLEKFMAYPQFMDISECEDEAVDGRGLSPLKRGTCGCTSNPRLYEVMDTYITEVCRLFHSSYVHIGLDEPFDFAVCARCQAELDKGKTKADLFYEHVMHSYQLLKGMGKTMLMWDDFFEYADIVEKLPRDIILCNWNYYFVTDEPSGHWTNRIKRDWFADYDRLGFRYIFCAYANGGACTYNVDTITGYAGKYHPYGAILTSWEKSQTVYLGTYPLIAYAAKRWQGDLRAQIDGVAVYEEIVQSKRAAECLLSLQMPAFYGGYTDVANVCENDNLAKMVLRNSITLALPILQEAVQTASDEAKDILTNIYDYYLESALGLRLEYLGARIFDNYEKALNEEASILAQLDGIEQGYRELEQNEKYLWEKYRQGVVSCQGAFTAKYTAYFEGLARLRTQVLKRERTGVLYADLMLHDGFGTPRVEIFGKYVGDAEERLLYKGGIKPSVVGFELGGCYTLRFRTENRRLEYIIFSLRGESGLYPLHFRHTANGEKTGAYKVDVLLGNVKDAQNVLYNDTRFACMGYDDGIAHFNDVQLCRKQSKIKIFLQ